MTLDTELATRSVCYLVTIGRTSGRPRRIEMWFAADRSPGPDLHAVGRPR